MLVTVGDKVVAVVYDNGLIERLNVMGVLFAGTLSDLADM